MSQPTPATLIRPVAIDPTVFSELHRLAAWNACGCAVRYVEATDMWEAVTLSIIPSEREDFEDRDVNGAMRRAITFLKAL